MFVWNQDGILLDQSAQIQPFATRLVRVVRELQDEVRGLVPSSIVAEKLAMPPRTVRYYLRRVEDAGLIFRPAGMRSGYSAIQGAICSLAVRNSIERQARQLNALDVQLMRLLNVDAPMVSSALVKLVDGSWSSVKRRLQLLERMKLVRRPNGERSGYVIASERAMRICANAEAMQLNSSVQPFHLRVLREIRWRERFCDAVSSRLLAEYLEIPERSMRYYLKQMEGMNLVHRPNGNKAGYRLTHVAFFLLEMRGDDHASLN